MNPPDPRALFDEHAAAVWELARRVTTSDAAAAAVFVGTFRSVRLRPGDVRWIRGSTLPWLLAVAARLSRPDRLAAPVAAAADGATFHPGTMTRLDQAEPAGWAESAVTVLNKLAPPARDVAVLCLLAGLSPADAALALAASERTVRRLIPRATAALGADGAATVPTDVVGRGTAVGLDLHAADDIAADSIPADLAVRVWAEHDDAPMQPAPAFPKRRVLICIGLVLAMLGALVWRGAPGPGTSPAPTPDPATVAVAEAAAAAFAARQSADAAVAAQAGITATGNLTVDQQVARCANAVALSNIASHYPPARSWAVGPTQVGATGIVTAISDAFLCATTPTTVYVSTTSGAPAGSVRVVRVGPAELGLLNPTGAEVTITPLRPHSGDSARTSAAKVQIVSLFAHRDAPFGRNITAGGGSGITFDAPLPDPGPTAIELRDRPVTTTDRSGRDGAQLGRCLRSPFGDATPDPEAWTSAAAMLLDNGTRVLAVRATGIAGVCAEPGSRQVFTAFPVDDPVPAGTLIAITRVGAVGGDDRSYTVLSVDPRAVRLQIDGASTPVQCVAADGVGVCAARVGAGGTTTATAYDSVGTVVAGPVQLP